MNFLITLKEINAENLTFSQKLHRINNIIQYYFRLEKGILNKKIFFTDDKNSNESGKLIKVLDPIDYQIINEIFTENTKKFLRNLKLKNRIDFSSKKDFLQVGINTVFIHEPIKGLWTTGKATFYFPNLNGNVSKIIMEVFSVIPNTVFIGQDGIILRKIPINKIQTKKIVLPLNKTDDKIIEIFIDVEKRWRPNVLIKNSYEIPMGVNIKSVMID